MSSNARITRIQTLHAAQTVHFNTLLSLREKGYTIIPIRQDKLFARVELNGRFLAKEIYVITLNYKEHKAESLLRKVLFCSSKLTFSQ
jgi:hypothetical protein